MLLLFYQLQVAKKMHSMRTQAFFLVVALLVVEVVDAASRTPSYYSWTRSTSNSTTPSLATITVTYPTKTQSLSHPLPVKRAIVSSDVGLTIPSRCISGEYSTAENRICRRLEFSMVNDGFPRDSPALMFAVKYRWMRYLGGGEINPFGLAAQWETFVEDAVVHSNVTHLTIQLAENKGLVVVDTEYFAVNLTSADVTLRNQLPQNSSYFVFSVYPSDERKDQPFLRGSMIASAMASIAASLLPMNPSLGDVQIGIMSGLSYCMQPTIHSISEMGYRALFPAAAIEAPMRDKLTSNIALLLLFTVFHLFGVAAVMLKSGNTFLRSCSSAMFPSVSISLALFLQPGNVLAGMKMITSITSRKEDRGVGVIGILAGIIFIFLPMVIVKYGFRAANRKHDTTLWGFPYLLKLNMPDSSWGPNSETHQWLVPACGMAPGKLGFVSLNVIYVTSVSIVAAFEPQSPMGCAAFFMVLMVLAFVHGCVVLRYRPYRSRVVCVATAVSNFLYIPPLAVSTARCFDLKADTLLSETAVASLFGLGYLVALCRAVGTIAAGILEQKLIRYKVWPDRKVELPTRSEREAAHQEMIQRRTAPEDPEVIERVESYRPPRPEVLIADPDVDSDEERQQFINKFGPPAPIKAKPLPKPSKRAIKSAALRDPMRTVLRDEGCIPPTLKAVRENEYALL